jgi:hypothetical protein
MIKLTDILNEAENPCWNGYKQVGMKTKNGKEVPNCVPESVEMNESQLKETMIRRAVDLAQEILPKDVWARYASDGQKNKEFVKSIVRDLAQMLNKFYKNYDVNVRIKENIQSQVSNQDFQMIDGIASILLKVKDLENRREITKDMIEDFEKENINFDYDEFFQKVGLDMNEDLRKWLGSGPTGGWDRYDTQGNKLGKCGDAKEGEPYAACLSNEKAAKLGKDGRAAFVKRKRAAQTKSGDAKKGGEQSKGQSPTFVKTGA